MSMSHQHHHDHSSHQQGVSEGLTLAFWLNLFFSIIEIFGGLWTNSTAIIADAFHDLMDAVTIGLAVFFEKFSKKKKDAKYSYGYRRFSLLSALILSVSLLAGGVIMFISAIRSFSIDKEVNSLGMLILAVFGILINGIGFLKLRQEKTNNNTRAVMLHLMEDVLGWVAVLIGAVVIYFTGWNWIDGILTLGIAGYIGYNAFTNLIHTMRVLLQYVPEDVNIEKLQFALSKIDGIIDVHDLHVWSLDGEYTIASVHIVMEENVPKDEIQHAMTQVMEDFNIKHPTIQIESKRGECGMEHCDLEI